MQLTAIQGHGAGASPRQPARKFTLLVDPDPMILEAGRLLLSGSRRLVQTAGTCVEVSKLPPEDEPQIAFLSDRLGSFQLRAVAEYVRHRWPAARIVVVGRAASFLEDYLYDEDVGAWPSNLDFLAAVEECVQSPERGRVRMN